MVNIGLKGSAEELGISCANSWYIPTIDGDMFTALDKHWKDPTDQEYIPMMISFPSMKDRAHKGDLHSCQLLIMSENKWFRQWAEGKSGDRAAEYVELKKKWLDSALYRYVRACICACKAVFVCCFLLVVQIHILIHTYTEMAGFGFV
jgi:hypothetical protein